MKNRLKFLIPVFLGLIAVTLYFRWFSRETYKPGEIAFSGNLELREVEVAFKMPGKIVQLAVDEGDAVQESSLIATLDDEQYRRQRTELLAQLDALRSSQEELRVQILFQEENLRAQLEQRQAEVRQARFNLSMLEEGTRRQEIEQAEAALTGAQAEYDRTKADYERAQELIANEDISRAQFDLFRTSFERADSARKQASERLDLAKEGPRRQEVEIAKATLARAEAGLRQTEAGELEIRRSRQALKTLDDQYRALQARLSQVEKQLEDSRASAPFSGIILTKPAELGEVVAAGTPVVTLGDLLHPWVRAYIAETDLGRVKIGAPVEILTDSFPGKSFQGKVSFIASEAEFTPKQIETREERVKMVYRLKIDVANPDQELKLNMPVEGVIRIAATSQE